MSGGTVPGGKASLPDRIDVVFLDAGGVLVSPDPDRVRDMLSSLSDQPTSPPPTDATLVDAHYRGMAAVDATLSDPEVFDAYLPAYFGAIDLLRDDVIEAAHELWSVPYRLWTRPLPGVRGALGALARSGRATVVVSNADGRVARALAGLVGIGPGSGHRVLAIVDWETATIGDPLLDLAGFCEAWCGAASVEAGWPSRAELIERYRAARDLAELPDLRYYEVLYNFRLCVLLEGVYQRSLQDPDAPVQQMLGDRALVNLARAVELTS